MKLLVTVFVGILLFFLGLFYLLIHIDKITKQFSPEHEKKTKPTSKKPKNQFLRFLFPLLIVLSLAGGLIYLGNQIKQAQPQKPPPSLKTKKTLKAKIPSIPTIGQKRLSETTQVTSKKKLKLPTSASWRLCV